MLFPRCGNIGVVGRDFQMGRGERRPEALENLRWPELPPLETPGNFRWQRNESLSTLGRAFACSGASDSLRSAKPSFAAENVFRSSGAPGRFRAARPVVMNSRNSLPALNEMTTVQVKGQ